MNNEFVFAAHHFTNIIDIYFTILQIRKSKFMYRYQQQRFNAYKIHIVIFTLHFFNKKKTNTKFTVILIRCSSRILWTGNILYMSK